MSLKGFRLYRYTQRIRNSIEFSSVGRWMRRRRVRRRWFTIPSEVRGVYDIVDTTPDGISTVREAAPYVAYAKSAKYKAIRNLTFLYISIAILGCGWFFWSRGVVQPAVRYLGSQISTGSRLFVAAIDMKGDVSKSIVSSILPNTEEKSLRRETLSIYKLFSNVRGVVNSSLGINGRGLTSVMAAALPLSKQRQSYVEEASEDVDIPPIPTESNVGLVEEDESTPLVESTDPLSVKAIIYHTHTSETYSDQGCSYLWEKYKPIENQDYLWGKAKGVVSVGDSLAQSLNRLGVQTVHSVKVHDYPDFRNAYKTALPTVEDLVKKHPKAEVVIDLHRDGLDSDGGTIDVDGRQAAPVTIVVTNDKFGLPHPDWKKNYDFALKLNQAINVAYPGLSRGVQLRDDARWNQHVHSHALIIEVGSNHNTTQEAVTTGELLALPLKKTLDTAAK